MDINITGNPGTGNTFQEIHIDTVQNYNPNATTVINNNYGDKQKPAPATEKVLQDAEREQRKAEIMDYVAKLKNYVAKDWKIAMNLYGKRFLLSLRSMQRSMSLADSKAPPLIATSLQIYYI